MLNLAGCLVKVTESVLFTVLILMCLLPDCKKGYFIVFKVTLYEFNSS